MTQLPPHRDFTSTRRLTAASYDLTGTADHGSGVKSVTPTSGQDS
jgi:hypothetical protein